MGETGAIIDLKSSQSKPQKPSAGHLLILESTTKRIDHSDFDQIPALEYYDGPRFRTLRTLLRENGWPPGLMIKIISAKHKLIDAMSPIEHYSGCLDTKKAREIREDIRQTLKKLESPVSVFIYICEDHKLTTECITTLPNINQVTYANGRNGQKLKELKQWFHNFSNSDHSYLYFFPDWKDYVYEPFDPDESNESRKVENRRYAHQVFEEDPPYDGLLLSLDQLRNKKGHLNHLKEMSPPNFRIQMNVPDKIYLFGDCGAFSYIKDDKPPLKCEDAARFYDKFGFDFGASVDHIPISSQSENKQKHRMKLTADYAKKFLEIHRDQEYEFTPIGSIQGITPDDYANFASQYIEWGYEYIALGGLVRRKDLDILAIVAAVRKAIQESTRGKEENIRVHLFGILRPRLQPFFRNLGVSSFDSASFLRKAWACPDKNYLMDDGEFGKWYGSIRVPFSASKALREVLESNSGLTKDALQQLEEDCLLNLQYFDNGEMSKDEVLVKVNKYSELLKRKGSNNHFSEKHEILLKERPWKDCKCKVCKDAGIHVVIFRGANRNRRRGFHNTWVFYHKILHRDSKKSSKK